jgi:BMFP domain-containing protein YqiC
MAFEAIDELARRLADAVPESLRSVKDDLENNFRSVLRSGLGKLDLVTRDEFEVQEAVLARTREKLESLEKKLKAIEAGKAAAKKTKNKTTKKKAAKKKATRKKTGKK